MATLYATTTDLRATLAGTDSGTGTAAALTDNQLTLALTSASNRISVFAGAVFDSSTPAAVPPDIFHDLCLDLAAFIATTTYMKSKVIGPTHPVWLRYTEAQKLLDDVRDGKLRLDIYAAGSTGQETAARIINRIPRIFTDANSNTRLDPVSGFLEPDTPYDMYRARSMWDDLGGGGGPVYQG